MRELPGEDEYPRELQGTGKAEGRDNVVAFGMGMGTGQCLVRLGARTTKRFAAQKAGPLSQGDISSIGFGRGFCVWC